MNTQQDTFSSNSRQAVLQTLRPLVAVLPFAPGSDDEQLRRLGGELADRLRERLAEDPAVRAILISSDFLAKAPPHALELVCRELGVGHVISGKCHGGAGAASLYIELSDTREWYIQWARFFSGSVPALLAPEGEEMAALAATLGRMLVNLPRR